MDSKSSDRDALWDDFFMVSKIIHHYIASRSQDFGCTHPILTLCKFRARGCPHRVSEEPDKTKRHEARCKFNPNRIQSANFASGEGMKRDAKGHLIRRPDLRPEQTDPALIPIIVRVNVSLR